MPKVRSSAWTPFFNGAVSNTAVQIKASAALVPYLRLLAGATGAFLQFWNLPSASVTVGTTAATWVVQLSANQDLTIVNGMLDYAQFGVLDLGGTGLTVAWTTTAGGSTAPANAVAVMALYV
jgi:hypothetical protein